MEHYFNLLENMENAPKITSSDLSEPDLKIYYENFLYFNSNSIWWVLIKNGNKSTLYRNWNEVYPYNFYPKIEGMFISQSSLIGWFRFSRSQKQIYKNIPTVTTPGIQ